MTEPRIANLPDALRDRAFPTVGVWNRLEGRPRTVDFGRSLRTEVRDPLWMLTRQWQTGEFRGTDGGSPVTARYAVRAGVPDQFRPGNGALEPLPDDRPLQSAAQRRALPFAFGAEPILFDLRLALGTRWLKLLAATDEVDDKDIRRQFIARYPIALPDPADDADLHQVAHPEVWAGLQAIAGRRMDGYLLYQHLKAGGKASDGINLPKSHRDDLDALGPRLTGWFDALIDQPSGEASWDPRRLEHTFSITAAEQTLTAAEYTGGDLDWHAFSIAGPRTGATAPAPIVRTVLPAPVRFSGMPLPRWWAVEDGRTNFAAVTPDSTDLARLVFLEFALVYSNDWYQLPCDLPAGTHASVLGLEVTDVFGRRLWVTPAGTGNDQDWQRWTMFTLDTIGDEAVAADTGLLLPPSAPRVAVGPAVEDVTLVRDENANLVWGIEQAVTLSTGDPRGGEEAAAETLTRRRLRRPAPPPDAPRAPLTYEVMTSVPENWIPFVPVHVPGDNRGIQLQRGAMPSEVDAAPVRPRTALLREGLDAGRAYFLNEEEVPRSGTRVTVAYHRARSRTGRPVVWLGARRGVGRGERSSGLAFDTLVELS